jgi:TetR/AcrR family transcriptional regulator, cholesterol catabolism regulator
MTVREERDGRERKSDRTRRRILDAAAYVLNRKGYAGARLTEIAGRAGLQVPAMYYYFGSREEILEEVVSIGARVTMRHVRARLARLPDSAGPLDRVCAAAGAHLETVLQEAEYAAAAVRTVAQIPPEMRTRQLTDQREYGALWRELLAAAVAAGEVDPRLDVRGARMLLIGALNWAPDWWDPERGTLPEIVATAELLVRNALSGGRTGPAPSGPAGARSAGPAPSGPDG